MHATLVSAMAGLFMTLCVWTAHEHAPRIEIGLNLQVEAVLAPVPTLEQTVDGRDVTLTGRVFGRPESEAMREAVDCLARSIESLPGVRTVRAEIEIASFPAPLTSTRTSTGTGPRPDVGMGET